MKQVLIATHGRMASGILYTAKMIVGDQAAVHAIDAYVDAEQDVEKEFDTYFEEHRGERIIVLTDILAGSVNQKLMAYAESDEEITLITGLNLPLLIQVLFAGDEVTEDELQSYIDAARKEMQIVGRAETQQGKQRAQETASDQTKASAQRKALSQEDYRNSKAKISALRIDDRLIHGQVAMTWTRQLKVQGIIVANDDAANDNTQKMALKMAVPSGIKVLIKPVQEAIRILNDPRASEMNILVLTRTVQDALRIRKCVGEIGFLNLGNTGRFDGIDVSEKTIVTTTIMLTDAELKAAKELAELDERFCMQQVPNDEQKLVKEVVARL